MAIADLYRLAGARTFVVDLASDGLTDLASESHAFNGFFFGAFHAGVEVIDFDGHVLGYA